MRPFREPEKVCARRTNPHRAWLRISHVNNKLNRIPSRSLALAGAAFLTATLAACSASPPMASMDEMTSSSAAASAMTASASARGTEIAISSLAFMPPSITIKAGSTVTWRNDEPITHTVTSGTFTGVDPTTGLRTGQEPSGLFDTRLAGQGDSFSYTYTTPGTYHYYCDIHYGMNATVIVTS